MRAPVDRGQGLCDPLLVPTSAPELPSLHDACVLRSSTPRAWAENATLHLPRLLVEQAHLEKKAAAAASRFLFALPQEIWIQRALSHLAREELVHFERTLRQLELRQIAYVQQPPSSYAHRLKAACAPAMPMRIVDELLVSALIEARSHERMEALGLALKDRDPEASAFYLDLVEAEARHRCVYLDIAAFVSDEATVRARFQPLAQREEELVSGVDDVIYLHGGHGA